jgi:hypothetical protein
MILKGNLKIPRLFHVVSEIRAGIGLSSDSNDDHCCLYRLFVYVSVVCEDVLGELTALLKALGDSSTTALVGSVDPALCETVAKVATQRTKSFITWSCPQVNICVGLRCSTG